MNVMSTICAKAYAKPSMPTASAKSQKLLPCAASHARLKCDAEPAMVPTRRLRMMPSLRTSHAETKVATRAKPKPNTFVTQAISASE